MDINLLNYNNVQCTLLYPIHCYQDFVLVTCFAPNLFKFVQLLRGQKAEIVLSSLPISLGFTPRCWVISNCGKMIIIGYEEGLIQVHVLIARVIFIDTCMSNISMHV